MWTVIHMIFPAYKGKWIHWFLHVSYSAFRLFRSCLYMGTNIFIFLRPEYKQQVELGSQKQPDP